MRVRVSEKVPLVATETADCSFRRWSISVTHLTRSISPVTSGHPGESLKQKKSLDDVFRGAGHSCCAKASSSKLSFPVAQLKDDRL
ncbi:hypothetical protein MRX96_016039 [Rhipicephalus microplus]